jgi:SAM-dependent methyltransferase
VNERAAEFDQEFWDARWSEVLRSQPDRLAQRSPSSYLLSEVDGVQPGRALDAGCGHGGEALWLAARGWRVTAVDFSAAALSFGRATAEALGGGVPDLVTWVEADLAQWTPEPDAYDLVSSLYVHVSGPVEEMVSRLAGGVAVGGRLLLVGHLPVDLVTGAETRAAGQMQVTVEAAVAALDDSRWRLSAAEARAREDGNGHDAVISAVRVR